MFINDFISLYESKKIAEEGIPTSPIKHRVGVTVSDPDHSAVTMRKATQQKTVRVSGVDREAAIEAAARHYKRQGYKVHDVNYIGPVGEVAESQGVDYGDLENEYYYVVDTQSGEVIDGPFDSVGEVPLRLMGFDGGHKVKTGAELKGLEEAVKLGTKVTMHSPGKDYHGQEGHVGEIRHGAFKGAEKTYTVDYANGKSVQLRKHNIKHAKDQQGVGEATGDKTVDKVIKKATKSAGTAKFRNAERIRQNKEREAETKAHFANGGAFGANPADKLSIRKTPDIKETSHDESHGSPYDRGSADAWYHRGQNPHKMEAGMKVPLTDPQEIQAYMDGYQDLMDQEGPNGGKQWESVQEDAEQLHVGDEVIITGDVQYQGKTGVIDSFGQGNRFVVVNLYNYGRHSFHSSDVGANEYADSDEERADNEFEASLHESDDTNPVAATIVRFFRDDPEGLEYLRKYGPVNIMDAADDVAHFIGDVEEIGSSDRNAYIKYAIQYLENNA